MNAARRVNLRDIAEASGVSIQTVSRAVRGLDVVAEPTRSRVMVPSSAWATAPTSPRARCRRAARARCT